MDFDICFLCVCMCIQCGCLCIQKHELKKANDFKTKPDNKNVI